MYLPNMPRQRKKTKYRGVYYRESETRTYRGRPDRAYIIWYQDAQGSPHTKTLGWTSQGVSLEFARSERQRIVDGLSGTSSGESSQPDSSLTVHESVELYQRWAEAEGKHISKEISRYNKHIKAALGALPISAVSASMLVDLKASLVSRMSPQSALHCLSFVRRCVNHALASEAYSGKNPFSSTKSSVFRMPTPDNKSIRFFTPEEAQQVLDAFGPRATMVRDMSITSLKTGLRATELINLTGSSIRSGSNLVTFRAKGGEIQEVHAPTDVIDMLLLYREGPGLPLFRAQDGGPLKYGIPTAWDRTIQRLKLNVDVPRHRRVRFHTWRHTFASWLAQSGRVTLQELKELMRHERIEMTLRYAHLIPGHQAAHLGIIDEVLHANASDRQS